jgi:peptide/nickel transport system substrate-binding protein
MNRSEMDETFMPGQGPNMVAEANIPTGTPLGDAVTAASAKYPYDPSRAERMMADAGWSKGSDGILTKNGERFTLGFRYQGEGELTGMFPVFQQQMLQVGIDLGSDRMTPGRDASVVNDFPGLYGNGGPPITSPVWGLKFDSNYIPTPQNRQQGTNRGGYNNPEYDRVNTLMQQALREEEIIRLWAQAYRMVTEDVAVVSMYFLPDTYIVRKTVTIAAPANWLGNREFQPHTWTMQ